MELGAGVGVGVGARGVGDGAAAGGALPGDGVGAGFDEAPTLPQPAITRMAAAETMATGSLRRNRKADIVVTFSVTRRSADFLGLIDE